MDEPVCKSVEMQLFYAVLDGREYAFGRTEAEAREALESSWAFGEPVEEDDHCKSGHWAQGPDDHGWRIVARMQTVFFVQATFLFVGMEPDDRNHVGWQCPICSSGHSEDVTLDDRPPIFATCGRTKRHPDDKKVLALLSWELPPFQR